MLHGNGRHHQMYTYHPAGVGGSQSQLSRQFESVYAGAHAAAAAAHAAAAAQPTEPQPQPMQQPLQQPAQQQAQPPAPQAPVYIYSQPQPQPQPQPQEERHHHRRRETSRPDSVLSISLTVNQCIAVLFGVLVAALLIAIVALCAQTHSRVNRIARAVTELARPVSSGFTGD